MNSPTSQPWTPPAANARSASDARLFAPATLRNREPILDVLRTILPATGLVLEIASGSGEHVMHFAQGLPALEFQPSDPSREAQGSIAAWAREAGLANIRPPLLIDAAEDWPIVSADAVLCINMVHISPWAATQGLVGNAGRILRQDAPLYLYGPYKRSDRPLEPGNAAFDASLRQRNPDWGLRDLDAVSALAQQAGFGAPQVIDMPANNLSVIFRKGSDA